MHFHFVQPVWLFGLLLLPLLALVHWQRVERERRALDAFAREPLLEKMATPPRPRQRLARGGMLIAALACGLITLAQPRWGLSETEALLSQDGSLVLVVDVSKSMLARDMGAESRLAVGQRLLEGLLPHLAGWKVGLVAFAGEGQALVPLTTDHSAVATLLGRAAPGQVPGAGSNLEVGLKTAGSLFTRPGKRVVLLLSDGEGLKGNPSAILPKLRQEGVQVMTLGVGTAQGAGVPGADDVWGNPTYMSYRGERVVSRLDENALKKIASDGGGSYLYAGDPTAGPQLQARLGTPGVAKPASDEMPDQGFELFQLPLALMGLLLVAEALWGLAGTPRRERRFEDHLREAIGGKRRGKPLAASLKTPATVLLLLAVGWSQTAWTLVPSWVPNREAAKAYEKGDYARAQTLLKGALDSAPDDWRLHVNMGDVYYQQGDYQAAANMFQRAWELAPESERPTIGYNLGNAYFRLAEGSSDPKGYARSIQQYESTLAKHPDDADAQHNLEIAKRRMQEAAKKPQGQNQQGQQGQTPQGQSGQGQTAVGSQPQRQPLPEIKNLPSQAEVDALLKALEADERQRQAEQGAEQNGEPPPSGMGQNLLQQALGSLDLEKDW